MRFVRSERIGCRDQREVSIRTLAMLKAELDLFLPDASTSSNVRTRPCASEFALSMFETTFALEAYHW